MRVKSIGHYHIVERIGEGGMGVVYRATDLLLRRDVALKILAQEFASDPQRMARLEREAQVLASFNHPNIATIHDLVDTDEGQALVMELVEGPTIADRLRAGPFPPEEILPLARQMVEALAAAHEKGIIHRDLKPANVKLCGDGKVKILDFGLAKTVEVSSETSSRDDTAAADLAVAGTLPYMSPEQLRGEVVDARTDIYSLGVTLYEMAVARKPFGDARGARLVGDIQYKVPLPPRSFNPRISRRLEEIILRCQEKDSDRRYATMRDVARALQSISSMAQDERSLAVLYFENLDPSDDSDYLCNGITEDIIVELSKIRGLSVLPRSSVLALRNEMVTAAQAGHTLGVSHVLDGSLRRAGNQLRITTALIETSSSRTIWAERYDRRLDDVFAIQKEIAQNIAGALRVVLSDAEKRVIAKAPTTSVAAYEHYLRGRQHFQLFRRKSIEFARDMFGRAIETDPEYSLAYAGLADCYSYLYMFWVATEENRVGADDASRRAVELDPERAEVHVARGVAISLRNEHGEAQKEFQRAIDLDPELFEAYYFAARSHYARGNLEDAVDWFQRAHEARPEDYQAPCLLASSLAGLGRMQDAKEVYRRTLQLAEKHLELNPGDTRAIYFSAICLVQLGEQRQRSLELASRALAMDPDEPQVLYNVACVYALLGQFEEAIDCLEQVMTHGDWWRRWCAHDPDLVCLHENPRYQALLEDG